MKFFNFERKLLVSAFFYLAAFMISLFPESETLNFNEYYRFPLSVGIEYQTYSPFGDYKTNSNMFGVSLNTRIPLQFFPQLQPALELGLINFDSLDQTFPQKWDHRQYYGLIGLRFSDRFQKSFEYGVEISGGASFVEFPNLFSDNQAQGSINLIGRCGIDFSLVPNYNFVFTIHPDIKYFYSLTSMKNFDGPVLGMGLSFQYRFGEDPDRPQAPLNSLSLGDISLPPVYANMHYYYTNHPIGGLVIANNETFSVHDIEVYFSQQTYMDSKSYCGTIPELKPGESREVDIFATFNAGIFDIEGTIPANGEISINYKAAGRTGEQKKTVSFELNDKTIVTWDDYNKAAALITPSDSALKNYCSFIQRNCSPEFSSDYNQNIQYAIQLYDALTEIRVIYQPDPVLPFSSIRSGTSLVKDTVSLPRDTLKRGSGDCDDLTVLFCSLLESCGVETGYVIIPGHIFPVFNTDTDSRSFDDLSPDREMTIQYEGKLWVPVEVTLIGKSGFRNAWQKGTEQFRENKDNRGFYRTRNAQEIYKPVALKENDLGLQYGDMKKVRSVFKSDLDALIDLVLGGCKQSAEKTKGKVAYNKLGSMYGRFGKLDEAEDAFEKALGLDSGYVYAYLNLAAVFIRKEKYIDAKKMLDQCAQKINDSKDTPEPVLVQIYSTISHHYKLIGDADQAKKYKDFCEKIEAALSAGDRSPEVTGLNNNTRDDTRFLCEQ